MEEVEERAELDTRVLSAGAPRGYMGDVSGRQAARARSTGRAGAISCVAKTERGPSSPRAATQCLAKRRVRRKQEWPKRTRVAPRRKEVFTELLSRVGPATRSRSHLTRAPTRCWPPRERQGAHQQRRWRPAVQAAGEMRGCVGERRKEGSQRGAHLLLPAHAELHVSGGSRLAHVGDGGEACENTGCRGKAHQVVVTQRGEESTETGVGAHRAARSCRCSCAGPRRSRRRGRARRGPRTPGGRGQAMGAPWPAGSLLVVSPAALDALWQARADDAAKEFRWPGSASVAAWTSRTRADIGLQNVPVCSPLRASSLRTLESHFPNKNDRRCPVRCRRPPARDPLLQGPRCLRLRCPQRRQGGVHGQVHRHPQDPGGREEALRR